MYLKPQISKGDWCALFVIPTKIIGVSSIKRSKQILKQALAMFIFSFCCSSIQAQEASIVLQDCSTIKASLERSNDKNENIFLLEREVSANSWMKDQAGKRSFLDAVVFKIHEPGTYRVTILENLQTKYSYHEDGSSFREEYDHNGKDEMASTKGYISSRLKISELVVANCEMDDFDNHFEVEQVEAGIRIRTLRDLSEEVSSIYSVYNVEGKLIASGVLTYDLISLPFEYAGIYLISVQTEETVYTTKIIKT